MSTVIASRVFFRLIDFTLKVETLRSQLRDCDWICFFLLQLVDDYPSDPKVKELVDKYDWYLLPVVNPDGYSYTWTDVSEEFLAANLKSTSLVFLSPEVRKHNTSKNLLLRRSFL